MARHGQSPDRPRDRPNALEVATLIRSVYERPRGGAGCCMHAVTDDGNMGDGAVAYTLDYARERGHADCIACLEALAAITTTQRRKAIAMARKKK